MSTGGSCSRFEWAKAIMEFDPRKEEQVVKELLPAKSSDFAVPANRPLVSVLNNWKLTRITCLTASSLREDLRMVVKGDL